MSKFPDFLFPKTKALEELSYGTLNGVYYYQKEYKFHNENSGMKLNVGDAENILECRKGKSKVKKDFNPGLKNLFSISKEKPSVFGIVRGREESDGKIGTKILEIFDGENNKKKEINLNFNIQNLEYFPKKFFIVSSVNGIHFCWFHNSCSFPSSPIFSTASLDDDKIALLSLDKINLVDDKVISEFLSFSKVQPEMLPIKRTIDIPFGSERNVIQSFSFGVNEISFLLQTPSIVYLCDSRLSSLQKTFIINDMKSGKKGKHNEFHALKKHTSDDYKYFASSSHHVLMYDIRYNSEPLLRYPHFCDSHPPVNFKYSQDKLFSWSPMSRIQIYSIDPGRCGETITEMPTSLDKPFLLPPVFSGVNVSGACARGATSLPEISQLKKYDITPFLTGFDVQPTNHDSFTSFHALSDGSLWTKNLEFSKSFKEEQVLYYREDENLLPFSNDDFSHDFVDLTCILNDNDTLSAIYSSFKKQSGPSSFFATERDVLYDKKGQDMDITQLVYFKTPESVGNNMILELKELWDCYPTTSESIDNDIQRSQTTSFDDILPSSQDNILNDSVVSSGPSMSLNSSSLNSLLHNSEKKRIKKGGFK